MAKDHESAEDSNRSANLSIHELSDPARRTLLRDGAPLAVAGVLAPLASGCATTEASGPLLGFKSVPLATADTLTVCAGYTARAAFMWGEPVGLQNNPSAFRPDASNTAAGQQAQLGMHDDGLGYFALDDSRRGLMAIDHEYTDGGLRHPDGMPTWSAAQVRKAMTAQGVSVIEIEDRGGGDWQIVRPSRYARRITAATPMTVGSPAAGHALLRTAADPTGQRVLGTLNNCAGG